MTMTDTIPPSLATAWRPRLSAGDAPVYARLVSALEADIAAGALPPDTRLPTHRQLADDLGVGVGTVTKAYAEAEAKGLITARVGRGSFVAPHRRLRPVTGERGGAIDLGRNVPPLDPAKAALPGAMARLARRGDLADCLDYAPTPGLESARRAGARWLARTANWPELTPDRVICTAGAQQAIAAAIMALCRPGDGLIAEAASFYGVKMLAARMGLTLTGAQMDDQGLTPDGLARAARDSGAKVVYVLPLQNPTSRLMGAQRRREIADTARRLDLILVEDDIYAAQATALGLQPLAALAPERTVYVSSLSKALAPGLRVGYLVPPPGVWFDRCQEALRAIAFGPPTFGGMVATDWIERGEAFEIAQAVNDEFRRRTDLARAILGSAMEPMPRPIASHIWLPLSELDAERVAGQALRNGVETTPPRPPFLDGAPVTGLRICLGAPADLAEVGAGLESLRAALDPATRATRAIV